MRITKEMQAESAWAISVAHAAPAIPQPKTATMTRSRITLRSDEKISRYRGIFDFPSALKTDESTLYMKRKGRPRKYILR